MSNLSDVAKDITTNKKLRSPQTRLRKLEEDSELIKEGLAYLIKRAPAGRDDTEQMHKLGYEPDISYSGIVPIKED